jgi:hypothetical protein
MQSDELREALETPPDHWSAAMSQTTSPLSEACAMTRARHFSLDIEHCPLVIAAFHSMRNEQCLLFNAK